MSEQTIAEEWRTVNGFLGYEVSNLGRVRSWRTGGGRGVRLRERCTVLKPTRLPNGYYQVRFPVGKKSSGRKYPRTIYRCFYLHRLVLEHFFGPCPGGMEACHASGDKSDNSVSNLRWDTPAGNARDKYRHGTVLFGERNPSMKLTDEQVREMIALRPTTPIADLAERYGVTQQTVSRICKGVKRKNLAGWPDARPVEGPDARR
jgi:hypothetical protein